MSFTAQDCMDEAREQHPAFDQFRTPESVLFRALNRYTRDLYFRVAERDSSFISSAETISFPLSTFADGHTMPAYAYISGGTLFYDDPASIHTEPLNIVPYRNRATPGVPACAYMLGGVMYFVGKSDDWQGVTQVVVDYAPEPTYPADASEVVPLSDGAKIPCTDQLAHFMARRQDNKTTPIDVGAFFAAYRDSETKYLIEVAQHSRSEEAYVREVW